MSSALKLDLTDDRILLGLGNWSWVVLSCNTESVSAIDLWSRLNK